MFFASTYTADYPYNPTPGDHPGEEGVSFHRDGDRLAADYYGGSGAVTVRRCGRRSAGAAPPSRRLLQRHQLCGSWSGGSTTRA